MNAKIFVGCVFAAHLLPASAQDSQCLFMTNQAATVHIKYTYATTDGPGVATGTGFIISPEGHVITNAHVVTPQLKDVTVSSANIAVRAGSLLNPPVEASVISRDAESDLALLKLPPQPSGAPWQAVAVSGLTDIAVGGSLSALGFAGSSDLALVPNGQKTAQNTFVDGQLKPWWQTNLALNPGNSGSPVFGRYGTVVGVAVALNNSGQMITYIIPIARAKHLLTAARTDVKKSAACAAYPVCQHASHGIERYGIDEVKNNWSAWRSGGYNRTSACNDFRAQLTSQFPNAVLTFIRDDENSKEVGFRHFEYRYFCEFRRQESPIYVAKQSSSCIEPD